MKSKKILITFLLAAPLLVGCGGSTNPTIPTSVPSTPTPSKPATPTPTPSYPIDIGEYGKIDETELHFLSFQVSGSEIGRMLTLPTDTYESLSPYFPTIPYKEGYTSEWDVIDYVYSETELVIPLIAYYTKIQ